MQIISTICTVLLLVLPTGAFAAPTPPAQSVWIVPENPKKGTTAELNALVYNKSTKSVTVSVLFSIPDDEIETISATIAPATAKTITALWDVAEGTQQITASVISAVDSNKKTVPELLGVVGTVTIGKTSSVETTLRGILGNVFSIIDPWRQKQAQHFTTLRDAAREKVGVKSIKEAYDTFAPLPPEVPAAPGDTKEDTVADLALGYEAIPIGAYITLIYATALATIFSSIALFYITLTLLSLLVLRFIIRIFI